MISPAAGLVMLWAKAARAYAVAVLGDATQTRAGSAWKFIHVASEYWKWGSILAL